MPKGSEFYSREMPWKKNLEEHETDNNYPKKFLEIERLFNREFAVVYFFV